MRKGLVWAALVLAAGMARAQQDGRQGEGSTPPARDPAPAAEPAPPREAPPVAQGGTRDTRPAAPGGTGSGGGTGAVSGSSDAFDRACIDLLHGRTPEGDQAIRTLRDACANLMSTRTEERMREERRLRGERQARADMEAMQRQQQALQSQEVQAGRGTAAPPAGQGVLAAFGQAGAELTNPGRRTRDLGMSARGPVTYSLVSNPIGWFTGLGVNATLSRAFYDFPKISWVAGARYSSTDATNGEVETFGALAGADLFIIGRNNEGLRIGPRLEVAAGRENFGGSTTFARLGLGGEIGYNFIASNGITGGLGAGLGGRVAGDSENDDFNSFVGGEFGPYLNLSLGYSW